MDIFSLAKNLLDKRFLFFSNILNMQSNSLD